MAPLPVDRNVVGGDEAAGDKPRTLPTPFLTKTYQLVDDRAIDDIISWNEDGSTFIVWNPTEFARDLLPKYFKHNNFSSFVRQLNTYGFRKIVPDRWEFSNDCFRRGEKKLLCDIQRRKIASAAAAAEPTPIATKMVSPSNSGEEQVLSSSDSPAVALSGSAAELIGENERLRKENMQLNKELSQMKNICSSIYALMSNFAGNSPNISNDQQEQNCRKLHPSENNVKPLDLLPMTRFCEKIQIAAAANGGEDSSNIRSAAEEISARLFGVPIGVKRGREGECSPADHDMDLHLQLPGGDVKSEPLDQDNTGDVDQRSWLSRRNSRNRVDNKIRRV